MRERITLSSPSQATLKARDLADVRYVAKFRDRKSAVFEIRQKPFAKRIEYRGQCAPNGVPISGG
jgi:hypothetical protein